MPRPKRLPRYTRWTLRRLRAPRMIDVYVRPNVVLDELQDRLGVGAKPALHVWRVLRLLHLWLGAPEGERAALFTPTGLDELEEDILFSAYDRSLGEPLSVIVTCLGPAPEQPDRLGVACICVADWATFRGHPKTKLAFFYCAAYATDLVRYFLIAEMARTSEELATLPEDAPVDLRRMLEYERLQVAEMIAAEGGLVSLTGR